MDSTMNNFISDQLHVAQQSRREKLRVQHCSPSRSGHRVDDYTSGMEVVNHVFVPDPIQVGDDNVRNAADLVCHPTRISSELLLDFSGNICHNIRLSGAEEQASSFAGNSSGNLVSSNTDGSLKPRRENYPENCGVWKSVGPNSNSGNWNMADYLGKYRKNTSVGLASDLSALGMRAKHSTTTGHRHNQMNIHPQLSYQSALSDEVTTAVVGMQPNYGVRGSTAFVSWGSYGGDHEHVRAVPHVYHQLDGDRLLGGSTWNGEMSFPHSRIDPMVVDSHSQGLSLSLCSNPATSMISGSQFGDAHIIPHSIPLQTVADISCEDSKPLSPTNLVRPSSVGQGSSLQEPMGASANYHRQTGPLGPFTGYAAILKSSRFLKPAQQLLDEYCGVIGKLASSSTGVASDRITNQAGDLATAVNSIESQVGTSGDILGVSTSRHLDSDEITKGATSSPGPGEAQRPNYQLKKAKLLYMLEEVSRRYKLYYQQMQMVVSAFESVAGLAAATPYISSALNSVSRHFNHLKNAISDQLRHIKTFLGEDFTLPGVIRNKEDLNAKRYKYTDHVFQRHKSGGSNMGLLEPQQHIWRPQRGLPERAVSVLRAWLFEHFLHPYPTDTDKHMLATQTGLTRSQVSNWFINARVRLWKPMVEEIHMLETKGLAERDSHTVADDNVSTNGADAHHLKADHSLSKMAGNTTVAVNLECSKMGSLSEMGDYHAAKQWNQENQSRVVNGDMTSMGEGMMSISGYRQTGLEMGGIGSVSLTLGLRQSADQMYRLEDSQHQPTTFFQQQRDRMRQHLGGHTVHEYAG